MDRRQLLRGLGTVTILVLAGGVWYAEDEGAFSQGRGPAFAPWKDWNQPQTGMLALVRAGILAASPHNTQPWLFHVSGNEIDVLADTSRNTGGLDPFLRELRIGIRCAIENMCVAAPTAGYAATVEPAEGELQLHTVTSTPQRIATVRCTPASLTANPLYTALPNRHTNRTPYELRSLPASFQQELMTLPQFLPDPRLFLLTEDNQRQAIVDLVSQCDQIVYADKAVDKGTVPWERVFKWKDVEQHRDGITLVDYGAPKAVASLLYSLPIPLEMALMARTAKGAYPKLLAASSLFGVIAVRERYAINQYLSTGGTPLGARASAGHRTRSRGPSNQRGRGAGRYRECRGSSPRNRAEAGSADTKCRRRHHLATDIHVSHGLRETNAPASPRRDLAQVLQQ